MQISCWPCPRYFRAPLRWKGYGGGGARGQAIRRARSASPRTRSPEWGSRDESTARKVFSSPEAMLHSELHALEMVPSGAGYYGGAEDGTMMSEGERLVIEASIKGDGLSLYSVQNSLHRSREDNARRGVTAPAAGTGDLLGLLPSLAVEMPSLGVTMRQSGFLGGGTSNNTQKMLSTTGAMTTTSSTWSPTVGSGGGQQEPSFTSSAPSLLRPQSQPSTTTLKSASLLSNTRSSHQHFEQSSLRSIHAGDRKFKPAIKPNPPKTDTVKFNRGLTTFERPHPRSPISLRTTALVEGELYTVRPSARPKTAPDGETQGMDDDRTTDHDPPPGAPSSPIDGGGKEQAHSSSGAAEAAEPSLASQIRDLQNARTGGTKPLSAPTKTSMDDRIMHSVLSQVLQLPGNTKVKYFNMTEETKQALQSDPDALAKLQEKFLLKGGLHSKRNALLCETVDYAGMHDPDRWGVVVDGVLSSGPRPRRSGRWDESDVCFKSLGRFFHAVVSIFLPPDKPPQGDYIVLLVADCISIHHKSERPNPPPSGVCSAVQVLSRSDRRSTGTIFAAWTGHPRSFGLLSPSNNSPAGRCSSSPSNNSPAGRCC